MYFLSSDEREILLRKLLPEARAGSVVEELRGWNWNVPPLAPIYEGKLSVWEVASQLCPTGHDLYLRRVLGMGPGPGATSEGAGQGSGLHAVVREVITEAKEVIYRWGADCLPALATLANSGGDARVRSRLASVDRASPRALSPAPAKAASPAVSSLLSEMCGEQLIVSESSLDGEKLGVGRAAVEGAPALVTAGASELVIHIASDRGQQLASSAAAAASRPSAVQELRRFTVRRVMSAVEEVLTKYPKIGVDGLVAAALPVTVGYRLDGSLLGLSSQLSTDVLMVGEAMPVVVRFGSKREFHRLVLTGYALVMESVWGGPVNVGCVVYVSQRRGRVTIEREMHIIGDEVRQQFIELRDERMRILDEEIDPGVSTECERKCWLHNSSSPD